jgi:hypothetical protein
MLFDEMERRARRAVQSTGSGREIEGRDVPGIAPEAMPDAEQRTRSGARDTVRADGSRDEPDRRRYNEETGDADKDGRQALNLAARNGV